MKQTAGFDAAARRRTAEWLALWARNGPELERRRVAELQMLTDESAARIAVELVWPMAPLEPGDAGEGLRRMQAVLKLLNGPR